MNNSKSWWTYRLEPGKGYRFWALLRLLAIALCLYSLRYQVLTWSVAGYDAAWRRYNATTEHNADCIETLQQLRGPGVRMLAVYGHAGALARVDDRAALPALVEVARHHPEPAVRSAALYSIGRQWDHRVPFALQRALNDPDPQVRLTVARIIMDNGDDRYREPLARAIAAESDYGIKAVMELARHRLLPLAVGQMDRSADAGKATARFAAVQFMSEFGDAQLNRQRLAWFVREAARNGAKIIVTPETAITGYTSHDLKKVWKLDSWETTAGLTGVSPRDVAETVPGPSTDYFAPLCKELGVYLTVTLVEFDTVTSKYFNTIVLLDPKGEIACHYRKRNPWPFAECGWASAGDRGLSVVDTPYGKLGLLVCYDINFEPPHLRKLGVDTLLYCIAWVDQQNSAWFERDLPIIARDNKINIVGANWTVPGEQKWSGYGQSLIIDREGKVVSKVTRNVGEEILYADLPIPKKR